MTAGASYVKSAPRVPATDETVMEASEASPEPSCVKQINAVAALHDEWLQAVRPSCTVVKVSDIAKLSPITHKADEPEVGELGSDDAENVGASYEKTGGAVPNKTKLLSTTGRCIPLFPAP